MAVGFIVNGNLPFLTAGDGTCGGDAVKFVVIVGMNMFHVNMSSLLLNGNIIKEEQTIYNRNEWHELDFFMIL